MSKLFDELKEGLEQAVSIAKGEADPNIYKHHIVKDGKMYYLNDVARIAFEMNKRWCELTNTMVPEYDWNTAPESVRKGIMSGVHFLVNNPHADYKANHENWLKDKAADNWVYGLDKNEEKKTHPCIVPHDQLPPDQQAKDIFFHTIVRALTA